MYVKFSDLVHVPDTPDTHHLFEALYVEHQRLWLKEPDDRFKLHLNPDEVWAPFSYRRLYDLPVLKPQEPTVSGQDYFNPYGAVLVSLYEEGNVLFQEVWMENGVVWIMNNEGHTIQKIVPFSSDPHWSPDDDHGPKATWQEPVENTGT